MISMYHTVHICYFVHETNISQSAHQEGFHKVDKIATENLHKILKLWGLFS